MMPGEQHAAEMTEASVSGAVGQLVVVSDSPPCTKGAAVQPIGPIGTAAFAFALRVLKL